MPKKVVKVRVFSAAFKQSAVERLLGGETLSALAQELHLSRKVLYDWKEHYRQGGPGALRGVGRPRTPAPTALSPPAASAQAALATAQKRIAELERKVGRQALELDFFEQALRRIESRTAGSGSMPPSTSKRRKAN
jgi:transposase